MERTRLTSNLGMEIFGVICIPIFIILFSQDYQLNFSSKFIIGLIISLFILLLFFLLSIKTIDFDDNYIYLKSNSKKEIVPIENITFIKLTMGGINGKDFWRIRYLNDNKEEVSHTFIPKRTLKTLFNLEELIKLKIPEADLENHAGSLDFIRDIIKIYRLIKTKFKK